MTARALGDYGVDPRPPHKGQKKGAGDLESGGLPKQLLGDANLGLGRIGGGGLFIKLISRTHEKQGAP